MKTLKRIYIQVLFSVFAAFAFSILAYSQTSPDSSAKPVDLQDSIVSAAQEYVDLLHVPYIWGGGSVGSLDDCKACRQCVIDNNVKLERRASKCSACRRCGMDCSHFINRVFKDAGIFYEYASSHELGGLSEEKLLDRYGFIDIGRDLNFAQAGDILVYPRHVVLLTAARGGARGDIVHATRFRADDKINLGGIRFDKNQDLKKYRGKLLRVLRHKSLFENPKNFS